MTDLNPERKRLLDKLAALLALATDKGAFAAEAATAKAKADELMVKYNLSLTEGSKDRGRFEVYEFKPWATGAQWEFDIAAAVARLCGCMPYFRGEFILFRIAGTVANLEVFRYMIDAVNTQRIGAWRRYKYDGGKDNLWAFCYAYGQALRARIHALLWQMGEIAAETERAKLWFESHNIISHDHEFIVGRGTSEAGRAAGGNVNLNRGQVGSGSGTPQRRIGYRR